MRAYKYEPEQEELRRHMRVSSHCYHSRACLIKHLRDNAKWCRNRLQAIDDAVEAGAIFEQDGFYYLTAGHRTPWARPKQGETYEYHKQK
jgi:hypothetical protein